MKTLTACMCFAVLSAVLGQDGAPRDAKVIADDLIGLAKQNQPLADYDKLKGREE